MNLELSATIDELTHRCNKAEAERNELRKQIFQLQVVLELSKTAEELATQGLRSCNDTPGDIIEASKKILRTDIELNHMHTKTLTDIRCVFRHASQ